MISGEIPVELGASWISPKCVEAQWLFVEFLGVKHCFDEGLEIGTNS